VQRQDARVAICKPHARQARPWSFVWSHLRPPQDPQSSSRRRTVGATHRVRMVNAGMRETPNRTNRAQEDLSVTRTDRHASAARTS
jgi:hypothetical protein